MSTVNLNLTRPGMSFTVTTVTGVSYEVRRDPNPTDPGPADSAKAHVFMTKGSGEEHVQYVQAAITVGNPWHISADEVTSKVTSITQH